jgi:hypothetical protein
MAEPSSTNSITSHLALKGGTSCKSRDAYHEFLSLEILIVAPVRGLNAHIIDTLAVPIYSPFAVGLLRIGLAVVVARRSDGDHFKGVGVGFL